MNGIGVCFGKGARCFAVIPILGLSLIGLVGLGQNAIPPAKQVEKDWADNRWNETDVGRFQASLVPLPTGNISKGLSILVGGEGQMTVCYDTERPGLRAFWRGGLLQFSSRRFGVVDGPKPAGEPVELLSGGRSESLTRWEGLSVHEEFVALRYDSDGRRIREVPWWSAFRQKGILVRSLTIAEGEASTVIPLLSSTPMSELKRSDREGAIQWIEAPNLDLVVVLERLRDGGGRLTLDSGATALNLSIPASSEQGTYRVCLFDRSEFDPATLPGVLATMNVPSPERVTRPGRTRWETIETKGLVSRRSDAYAIDTLTVPYENPWDALMFLSGVDFLSNGDAAVCTMHGDVWLVRGIDTELEHLSWHRFATGLYQPLGLRVRDDVVYVLGRDQITALEDIDGDGHADFYRNHSNLIKTQPGHRFVTSLEQDNEGRFYYVDPLGLHRVSSDGAEIETIATGWRNPNGMGRSPEGILTVAPQQGGWTPSSQISQAKPGGFYGAGGPQVSSTRPLGYDPPLCWIPHAVDNSGGSQVWAPKDDWGPLSGRMIHLSYGRCSMMLGLRDSVNGQAQGGVVPLPGRFLSGAMRGAVNPVDGQLYVVGSTGWQTSALRDGSLQRVRYTGKSICLPIEIAVHANGIRLEFSEVLDSEWAVEGDSYGLEQWNYKYSKTYGSKDYSVINPSQEGRDPVEVTAVHLAEDGQTVFLVVPEIAPVMQMAIQYNLRSRGGERVRGTLYHTIHHLRPAATF